MIFSSNSRTSNSCPAGYWPGRSTKKGKKNRLYAPKQPVKKKKKELKYFRQNNHSMYEVLALVSKFPSRFSTAAAPSSGQLVTQQEGVKARVIYHDVVIPF